MRSGLPAALAGLLAAALATPSAPAESPASQPEVKVLWRADMRELPLAPEEKAAFAPKAGLLRIVPAASRAAGKPVAQTILLDVPLSAKKGEWLAIECRMRALQDDAGPAGQAGLVLDVLSAADAERAEPQSFFRHILLAGPEWESFRIPFQIPKDLASRSWKLRLNNGIFAEQGLELEGLRIVKALDGRGIVSPPVYPGQEPAAEWRAEAARRIEEHRKAPLTVKVITPEGIPLPGAKVLIEQLRHAYGFGTAVQADRIIDAPRSLPAGTTREQFLADNARYRQELLRLFNLVVFENDQKWPVWSGSRPAIFRQEWTVEAAQWLQKNALAIKGHTMVWASWQNSPVWLRSLENQPDALQQAILRHVEDIGQAFVPFCVAWDVLNEPMSHRDLIELLGVDAVAEWFKAARRSAPGARLVLNEFDLVGNGGSPARRKGIIELVRALQERGAGPDVIGCQSHFWSDRLTPPERIWQILDELHAATGLPLTASEFDMNFPNDQVQAEYTRDFLTAWFSHPATESFIMWGFWGGAHWFGERGAMFRTDWTPKPNLEAYTNLVLKEWWTRQSLQTAEDGTASTRAFLGHHKIVVEAPGCLPSTRIVELGKGGRELRIVLHTPNIP